MVAIWIMSDIHVWKRGLAEMKSREHKGSLRMVLNAFVKTPVPG